MANDGDVTGQFQVFDLHPNRVCVLDQDLRFIYQNRRHVEAFGASLGEPCYQVHRNADGPCPACPTRSTLSEGRVATHVSPLIRKGPGRFAEVTSFPVAGPDGRVLYSVNVSQDITERKQTEDELILFKTLINQSNDAIFIVDPATSRIMYVNRKACSNLGYEFEGLLKLRILDVGMNVHEDLESWRLLVERVRRNGYELFETEQKRSDGSTIPVEINVRLINHDGREYMFSVVRDITERKRVADVLLEEKHKLEAVISAIGDGITLQDRNFKVLYQNNLHREMQGDHAGEFCYRAYQHRDDVCEGCQLVQAFEDGKVHRRETSSTTERGTVHMEVTAAPLFNAKGEVVAGIEVVRNTTDRKTLEAQLVQSQKMEAVGHLAGGIAHDFNNILTVINGFANLLDMKLPQDHPLKWYVEPILSGCERAAGLTNRLLLFSRKQVLNPRPVDLNEVVSQVEKLLLRLITEDIELRIEMGDGKFMVLADSSQIEQVLMNLVTNARDAMPQGGSVTITTEKATLDEAFVKERGGAGGAGDYVLLTVTDTGVGMDGKTRSKIFDPFFTTKEVGKGSGLGLSMVFGIVSQHKGLVTVSSRPGRFSSFGIYLPLTAKRAARSAPKELQQIRGGTETILVAEDESEVRELARKVLEEYGYRVIEAVNGADAVERFKQNQDRVQLLIFDVVMPRMNGKEAFDLISAIRPGIKTLFMSGYDNDILKLKGGLDREFDFMAKPVSPRMLLPKVREILDRA